MMISMETTMMATFVDVLCALHVPCAGVNLTFPTVSNLFLWVVLVRLVGGCES